MAKMHLKNSYKFNYFSLLFIMLTIHEFNYVKSEVFTALVEMEELLDVENVLILNLHGYIKAQEDKLDFLREKLKIYTNKHSDAVSDSTTYVSNPINAYILTKRLTTDWSDIEKLITFDVGEVFMENITKHRTILKFPSDEDLNGAAAALVRLQDTYNLETSSVARGELNGIQYSTAMSAGDCFELGRQSYINGDYYHTSLWMREAMDRLMKESNDTLAKSQTVTFTRADILEYLAFSTFKQGNVMDALSMTNELLVLIPDHERAKGNKNYYEKQISQQKSEKLLKGDDGTNDVIADQMNIQSQSDPKVFDLSERRLYELLCRGDIKPSPAQLAPLRCRYVNNNSAFLKIAPLKLEEANLKPYIVVYHDIMYDSEIELIKKLAKPRFRRATVQNHKTGAMEIAHYRISKSAWLKDEEHSIIRNIALRVEDMTGLSVESAEELQVVNYGIGGHYEPHFDFARKEETNAFKHLGTGNRIATVLFYMSDVEQGGATVFPKIRTALWPKKGTAAFWMNLHASGEGDYLTRHAACPVLTGSKWVSNKWIHETGQEFLRPCELEPDHPPMY